MNTTRREIIKGGIAATSLFLGGGISVSYGDVRRGAIAARSALNRAKNSSPIPPEYMLVKGLCPNALYGDTKFATGIYNDSPWQISCKVPVTSHRMNNNSFNIFGAILGDTTIYWSGYGVTLANPGAITRMLHGGGWKNTNNISLHSVNEVTYDCGVSSATCTVNGVSTTLSSSDGLTGYEIFIGSFNRYGLTNGVYAGESIISRNGMEVAHLYPCVRLSDNTPLFYDAVQNIERLNQGRVALNVLELDDPV